MPQRRPRWRNLAVGAGCLVLAFGLGALYAFLRTPNWYAPPQIPVEGRQAVRNKLVEAEQAFTEGLRSMKGPFTYHLFQDDVNRWIAMRREIYPLVDELAPPVLADPFVLFEKDEIVVAGRYDAGGIGVILSLDIDARFERGQIVLTARAIRCGSVTMPMSFGELGLSRPIQRDPNETWPGSPRMSGDFLSGFRIDADAWWKNGGIDYRVLDLRVAPGKLELEILPLGRHSSQRSKDHSSFLSDD